MGKYEIVLTADGSHTLKQRGAAEHFHSTFGAVTESTHVFVRAGLMRLLESGAGNPRILEMGFGTGLNALLTMISLSGKGLTAEYIGLEAFPLDEACLSGLNYAHVLADTHAAEYYRLLHSCEWGVKKEITPGFFLHKVNTKLEDFRHEPAFFNLVYFDAFSPEAQAELWTEEVFEKIAAMTASGGIFVTYSCKGSVKRALKASGFAVEKIAGPPGKREMIRGIRQ
jgi:tRNA U34 5-methylaminomethyl-2-thiouridine-forming methyltransferase MnmC